MKARGKATEADRQLGIDGAGLNLIRGLIPPLLSICFFWVIEIDSGEQSMGGQ